ncbi:MAG: hypothetical protein KatS3mg123_2983 [Burkholderiales bacterium]|nr:MAG: hypothetical protein KatS3mg123_2983 [Burkholderiales bacterium]
MFRAPSAVPAPKLRSSVARPIPRSRPLRGFRVAAAPLHTMGKAQKNVLRERFSKTA